MDNKTNEIVQQQKKRGRPKKNLMDHQLNKPVEKKHSNVDLSKQRELILHLPMIHMNSGTNNKKSSSDSDTNKYTAKETENIADDALFTISDNCSVVSNVSDIDNNSATDVHELLLQLNSKDLLIKKLQNEINCYKCGNFEHNITTPKDNKYVKMNLKLFDSQNGKNIVIDKTNVACWWCTYNFDTVPCFIPERFDNDTFYVFGCFCTFNCAMAYNLNMGDYKMYDRFSLIKKLYYCMYDNNDSVVNSITIAPPREILEKFGGHVSIEDYRKNFQFCKKEYKMLMPSMVQITPYIEEKNKDLQISVPHSVINKNDTNNYDKKFGSQTIFDTFYHT